MNMAMNMGMGMGMGMGTTMGMPNQRAMNMRTALMPTKSHCAGSGPFWRATACIALATAF
jgi:hypothetical protein